MSSSCIAGLQLSRAAARGGLVVLYLLLSGHAHGDELEQRPVHEHGKVTLSAAIEGTALAIELSVPAINVVGFEHAPRSAEEQAAARRASVFIRYGRGMFGVPADAHCRFAATQFTEPQWESEDQEAAEAHGHAADREHHADYEARFTFHCSAPKALTWFEPWVLERLHDVTEARVNLITPSGQRSEVVKRASTRISLL